MQIWKFLTDNLLYTASVLGFAGFLALLTPKAADWFANQLMRGEVLNPPVHDKLETVLKITAWISIGAVTFCFLLAKSYVLKVGEARELHQQAQSQLSNLKQSLNSQFYCRVEMDPAITYTDTPGVRFISIEIGPSQVDWEDMYLWIPKEEASVLRLAQVKSKGGFRQTGVVYELPGPTEAADTRYLEFRAKELNRGNSVYLVTGSPLQSLQFGSRASGLSYQVFWDTQQQRYVESKTH